MTNGAVMPKPFVTQVTNHVRVANQVAAGYLTPKQQKSVKQQQQKQHSLLHALVIFAQGELPVTILSTFNSIAPLSNACRRNTPQYVPETILYFRTVHNLLHSNTTRIIEKS